MHSSSAQMPEIRSTSFQFCHLKLPVTYASPLHSSPQVWARWGKVTSTAHEALAPGSPSYLSALLLSSGSLDLESNRDGKGFFHWLGSVQLSLCQEKCTQSALLLQVSNAAPMMNSFISFCSQLKMLYLQLITEITVFHTDLPPTSDLSSLGFTFQVPTSFFII